MATTSTQQPPVTPAPSNNSSAVNPVAQPVRPQVSASLYIGDLEPEIGESALYDFFKDIGAVASIRVCRDSISRVSLGYAYVNFHNVENAERAISVLNGALLNKRPCRIMWSRRDPSIRKSGVGNIFIKNLDSEIDHAGLYDLFSTFGNIYSCKLATGKDGKSKGYGFVHYHQKESADSAIAQMSDKKLNGKKIYVAPFIPARERTKKNPDDIFTNVYVKNISSDCTPEMFKNYFSKFGDITSPYLVLNEDGTTKGFGFVNFSTHEEALNCVNQTNGKEFCGKILYTARAQSKAERLESLKRQREELANKYLGLNLYVKNIDDSVDEEKLRKLFSEFGTITSVKIMKTEKNTSKGFGFICFSTPEEATRALTKMYDQMVEGKPLYVAHAQRKEQRRAQLEAQHALQSNISRIPQMPNPMFPPHPGMLYPNRSYVYSGVPFRGGGARFNPQQAFQMPYQQNVNHNRRGVGRNVSGNSRNSHRVPTAVPVEQNSENNSTQILAERIFAILSPDFDGNILEVVVNNLVAAHDHNVLSGWCDNRAILLEKAREAAEKILESQEVN